MSKINLVIADEDKGYNESIARYFIDKHPHKFQVSSFTNPNILFQFLLKTIMQVDIMLITPEFYRKTNLKLIEIPEINDSRYDRTEPIERDTNISGSKRPVLIFLTGTKTQPIPLSYETAEDGDNIYKYQHGDKIISSIMHIYEKYYKNSEFAMDNQNGTKLISVYSSIGGAGKTTVAVNACINCAREGMKVFYINLEDINSTFCFFEPDYNPIVCDNFSHIIFSIKEKDKNLAAKIEGIKYSNNIYDIHYLPPPNSALEMEELLPEEVKHLLKNIVNSGYYDIVFVDLSSALSLRNIAIMEESNEIIFVYIPGSISKFKTIKFFKEIELYQKRKEIDLLSKIAIVGNKFEDNTNQEKGRGIDEICSIIEANPVSIIPLLKQSMHPQDSFLHGNMTKSNSINKGLLNLTEKYTSKGGAKIFF